MIHAYIYSYFYMVVNYFNPLRLLSGVWCVPETVQ